MIEVRGRTNIVDYFDHNTAEWMNENGFGCDLLIRMELLYDLRGELERGRIFSEAEVIQIGKDICSALVICHGKNILHRDIKPENIFFNDDGDYKLGDFGIARILDECPGSYASTGVGTPEYIAPEQIKGKYDMSVDIYSLGLVLYELTNQNRLPFVESPYWNSDVVERRIRAKTLPPPCNASADLAEVILKACAHAPSDRYQSAQEMLNALDQLSNAEPVEPILPVDATPPEAIDSTPIRNGFKTEKALPDLMRAESKQGFAAANQVLGQAVGSFGSAKKKNNTPKIIAAVLTVVVLIGAGIFAIPRLIDRNDEEQIASIITEANTLAGDKDYEGTLTMVQTALVTYPKSAELQNKADEYAKLQNAQTKSTTLAEAETLAESGDYVAAIAIIKKAQEMQGDDAD